MQAGNATHPETPLFSAHNFQNFLKQSEFHAVRKKAKGPAWPGLLPLILLPILAALLARGLPAWGFMWALAFALYAGCKWLTWWDTGRTAPWRRTAAYLFLWPGMDARTFLDTSRRPLPPKQDEWFAAAGKVIAGTALLWGIAREMPAGHALLKCWVANTGMILILHFGTFHLLSLLWRELGIDAAPLMDRPLLAKSLGNFWGERWNRGFQLLMARLFFAPLRERLGVAGAAWAAFLASGLIHDLVITVPTGGGYGLPTLYFLIQCAGLLIERSALGRRIGLRRGLRGWVFTMTVVAAPIGLLFPPVFLERVMLPFYQALGVP